MLGTGPSPQWGGIDGRQLAIHKGADTPEGGVIDVVADQARDRAAAASRRASLAISSISNTRSSVGGGDHKSADHLPAAPLDRT
jgi:hypothetical protein